jgi:hypothetical protein
MGVSRNPNECNVLKKREQKKKGLVYLSRHLLVAQSILLNSDLIL